MWNVEGAIGGPLTDRWSARASVLYQRRDDWVDNTYPGPNDGFEGYDESAARVQFLYEGDAFEALRSEEHTSELQSLMAHLVCRLLIEKKTIYITEYDTDIQKLA